MGDDEARPAYTLPTSPIIFLLGEMMIAPPDTTTRVQRILAVPFITKISVYMHTHAQTHGVPYQRNGKMTHSMFETLNVYFTHIYKA